MVTVACMHARRAPVHRLRTALRRASQVLAGRLVAALLLIPTSPLAALSFALGARLRIAPRIGRHGKIIPQRTVELPSGKRLPWMQVVPRLLDIVLGHVAWVGPEPRPLHALDLRVEPCRRILSVRPGIVCSWRLRQRTNIAFESQIDVDCGYVADRSLKTDLGIFFRSLLTLGYGSAAAAYSDRIEILGLPLDNLTMNEAVTEILKPAPAGRARQVSFVNVDCINQSYQDQDYRRILQDSDLRLGDGIGLRLAGRLLNREIRQNVNGTDLFPRLCQCMQQDGLSLFLLGGRPGVAEAVAQWTAARFPALKIAGTQDGYFAPEHEQSVLEQIRRSGASVLLVAFGAPRQEKWIRRHLHRLDVRSALGVGGLFDFYSGRIPRAPEWMRELGLEWTYRLYQEPGRMWKRYLVGNILFLWRMAAEKLREQAARPTMMKEIKPL